MRAFLLTCVLAACAPAALRADAPALLHAAIGAWTAGKEDWSFVRRTRVINDKGDVKQERVETYDPSLPDNQRWHLLEVNKQPPTPSELASEDRKNHRPRRFGTDSTGQMLDLEHAVVKDENPMDVTYQVPIKSMPGGLIQTDRLVVLVTVNRKNQTVERLTARLTGPMRIALGLAKITDVDLDLNFDPTEEAAPLTDTSTSGTAHATLSAFGERMEYEWTDFKPVRVYRSPA